MAFYEIIYETGAHSIAEYSDDAEALSAITEQHRRATSGEGSGPDGSPATRIKRVLKYDEHPASYNEEMTVDPKEVTAMLKGFHTAPELVAAIYASVHPRVAGEPFDSNYRMEEKGELEAAKWGGE